MQRWLASRFYYGWVMVGAAVAINAVSSTVNPVVFSFMIGPMSDDLGVSTSALTWAYTFRLIAAGLAGPVLGIQIDRHGTRWIGVISGSLVATTMVVLAAANDLWLIYAIFAVSGLAGLGGPAGQLLTQVPIARWFVAKRGRALSIATMGMAGGTVFTAPITGWLVDGIGWRGTSIIYGLIVLSVVPTVSALLVRRAPEDLGLHPDGADAPPAEDAAPTSKAAQLATTHDWTVREAMRTTSMWLLLGVMFLAGLAVMGTLVHRVDYWESTGMSPRLVAFATMMDPLTVVFAIFAVGMIADRVPVRFLGAAGLGTLGLSIVPLIITDGQLWTAFAHNVVWGCGAGGSIALNNLVWPNYFGRLHLGTIRGIVLPVSIAASSAGAPIVGYLMDAGIEPRDMWTLVAITFGLAAMLTLLARPPRPDEEPAMATGAEPGLAPATS